MLKLAAAEARRDHAADRARIGGVVRMTADVPVYGTDVQTGAAANAVQHFPFFGVGQQAAASVIKQDAVKFLRAISFTGAPRPADERAVGGDGLSCARGGKHRPQRAQIFETRNDLFDTSDRYVDARQARAQPAVTLVGGDGDDTAVCNKKV